MSELKFLFPIDGDFVNSRDGRWQADTLLIEALLASDDGCPAVCGVPAAFDPDLGCWKATVPLRGQRNCLIAETATHTERITVLVTPEAHIKKFRISSDDNIRFLQELNRGDYASIFDHPYLAVYKKAHDLYGAKVHLNLFYAFDGQARGFFADNPEYFDLSMMTDRYKEEFIANSHWLKLAFHAHSEFPDKPYQKAPGDILHRDCVAVCREICRFAGPECISNSTTVHWGEATREGVRALRSLGFTSLTGYFYRDSHNVPIVSYYLDPDTADHIGSRDFFLDTQEDMIFGRIDSVLNIGSKEAVLREVRAAAEDPHRGGFVSLMIHEQYFYPDYVNYMADFEARVLESCKILADLGYIGGHISEVTEPRPLADHPSFRN